MTTALLVVDVQNALCQGPWAVFHVQTIVARINAVIRHTRATGGTVIFIQHEEAHETMRHGSPGWQLFDALEARTDDLRVRKTACDAFFNTDLRSLLAARGVDHVRVCGMQTEYCVDSTVRGALANGLSVTLAGDGHSTLDNGVLSAEQIIRHHNATMANLGNFGPTIEVRTAAEVCAAGVGDVAA